MIKGAQKLDGLVPDFKARAAQALTLMDNDSELRNCGVTDVIVVESRRPPVVQFAYVSRLMASFAPPKYQSLAVEYVQSAYRYASLEPPSPSDCLRPISWTLKTKHIDGLAIDIAPMRDGKIWWDAPTIVWMRMGAIGESCGLVWGGRWKETPDMPHYEAKDD